MDCRELIESLSECLEGGLDPFERVRFDEHLAACKNCATYLDSFRTTLRLLRISRNKDSPAKTATIPASLHAVILAARILG